VGALPPLVTAVPAVPVVEPAVPALEDVPPELALVPAVAVGVPAVGVLLGVFSSGASTLHAAPSSSAPALAKLPYRLERLVRVFWLFMAYFT
jgi:hypothetical protein